MNPIAPAPVGARTASIKRITGCILGAFKEVLAIDPQNSDVGGVASLDNVLKLDGDTNDSLSLDPADGWSAPDTVTLAGYAIYAAGNVKIAVDQDITVAVA